MGGGSRRLWSLAAALSAAALLAGCANKNSETSAPSLTQHAEEGAQGETDASRRARDAEPPTVVASAAPVSAAGAHVGCDNGLAGRGLSVAPLPVRGYGRLNGHGPLPLRPREVVLTFDDGPHPRRTRRILEILDRYCVKATFFVVGRSAVAWPHIIADMVNRGHTLGNHTYTHPILTTVGMPQATREIERADAALERVLLANIGSTQALLPVVRFPGLGENVALRRMTSGFGLRSLSADVGSDDYLPISSGEVARRVIRRVNVTGGGMILFHDTHQKTVEALPAILDYLAANGYRVVALRP